MSDITTLFHSNLSTILAAFTEAFWTTLESSLEAADTVALNTTFYAAFNAAH